jgi:hypothetical protein
MPEQGGPIRFWSVGTLLWMSKRRLQTFSVGLTLFVLGAIFWHPLGLIGVVLIVLSVLHRMHGSNVCVDQPTEALTDTNKPPLHRLTLSPNIAGCGSL